jgi:hypothetical protein
VASGEFFRKNKLLFLKNYPCLLNTLRIPFQKNIGFLEIEMEI